MREKLTSQAWVDAVGDLIRRLHTERFPAALDAAASEICSFDSMIVTVYFGSARPQALYHDLNEVQAATSISFYETGPYLLDPFYLACRSQRAPGPYRLVDLVPNAFFRSEYYRTFYRRIKISDEMGLLVRGSKNRWYVVSLARRMRREKFDSRDVDAMSAVFGVLAAAVLQQWDDAEALENSGDSVLQERLRTFGWDVLSPREKEVVQLLLQGHSTPSAAANLDISEGTVKVHRRHAYAKLGISSQSELFSLAMRYVAQ